MRLRLKLEPTRHDGLGARLIAPRPTPMLVGDSRAWLPGHPGFVEVSLTGDLISMKLHTPNPRREYLGKVVERVGDEIVVDVTADPQVLNFNVSKERKSGVPDAPKENKG